jgi:hypothetical protein
MTNRKKAMLSATLILALSSFVAAEALLGATCTGADPCNACKNCKYCKHCAKEGGKCGVCKRNDTASSSH